MTGLLKGAIFLRSSSGFFYEALLSLLSWATGLILLRKDTGANCIENKNFIFFQVYKIVPITYNIMVKDSTQPQMPAVT